MEILIKKILKKYRRDLMPFILVLAGIIMLWIVIIPQVGEVNDLRGDMESQKSKNEELEGSLGVLDSLNETELDANYQLVMRALPQNKSISLIYESLVNTSFESNVTIGSLNLEVGNVYTNDGAEAPRERNVEGVPFLNMLVRVNGESSEDAANFADVLYEAIPVVEIEEILATDADGRYDVDFFFKPIDPKTFEAQTRIDPLGPDLEKMLTTLRSWDE